MKLSVLLPLAVGGVALTGMIYTFVSGASPYVTIAQAKTMSGDRLHLSGDILKETLIVKPRERKVFFDLRDEKGDVVPVVFSGPPPANMGEATKVVAIGGMKGAEFHANDMLLKCPSKYESAPGAAPYAGSGSNPHLNKK